MPLLLHSLSHCVSEAATFCVQPHPCVSQAFRALIQEAKLNQSLPSTLQDKLHSVPLLRPSAESPSSQGNVNLATVESGGGDHGPAEREREREREIFLSLSRCPAKALIADSKTSVLSMAGPNQSANEPDMTIEAASQMVLEGAMKRCIWSNDLDA